MKQLKIKAATSTKNQKKNTTENTFGLLKALPDAVKLFTGTCLRSKFIKTK